MNSASAARSTALPPRRHRFTVAEYHRMGTAGLFGDNARTELIDGDLIDMAPIGSRHADFVNRLVRLLVRGVGDEITVSVQNPLRLSDHSEPEPDLALLRPRQRPYAEAHPGPEDALLVIEVADTSLDYDRSRKLPLYARHGIAEVWLFDLEGRQLEVWRDPSPEGYRRLLRPRRDEPVAPALLAELSISLRDLFPSQP